MIRMPPYLNNCTSVFPRTTRCDGQAIYYHPAPITRRFFYAVIRWGWVAVPALLAVAVLTGCGEVDTYRASQSDLSDAQAQARKEWRQIAMGAQQ